MRQKTTNLCKFKGKDWVFMGCVSMFGADRDAGFQGCGSMLLKELSMED
jgi:hypothetical protein